MWIQNFLRWWIFVFQISKKCRNFLENSNYKLYFANQQSIIRKFWNLLRVDVLKAQHNKITLIYKSFVYLGNLSKHLIQLINYKLNCDENILCSAKWLIVEQFFYYCCLLYCALLLYALFCINFMLRWRSRKHKTIFIMFICSWYFNSILFLFIVCTSGFGVPFFWFYLAYFTHI